MPPALPKEDSPLDRATSALLARKPEEALAWAGGVLRQNPASPSALYVIGRALLELSQKPEALDALGLAVKASIGAGVLAVGVASAHASRDAGGDPSKALDALAAAFAKGSPKLKEGAPPPPPRALAEVKPLVGKGDALTAEIAVLLEAAKTAKVPDTKVAPLPLFSSLGKDALARLLPSLSAIDVAKGQAVVKQGDPGQEAFIVVRGGVVVRRDEPEVVLAHLGAGALFGEMSLLSRAPRAASVVASRPSVLLRAPKEALDKVGEAVPEVARELAAHCLRRMVHNLERTSPLLAAVPEKERPALVRSFETRTYEKGEALVHEGEDAPGLFLIASGEVTPVKREGGESFVLASLGPGDTAGEVSLVLRRPATADVVATHPTVALFLPKASFLEMIKQHPLVIAHLYALAVQRDDETLRILSDEVLSVDDVALI